MLDDITMSANNKIENIFLVPVAILKYKTNSSVQWGSWFEAECVAAGDPLPSVRWILDGKLVCCIICSF